MSVESDEARRTDGEPYVLDEQVGFLLRQAQQRHAALFAECFGDDLTPTQWAAISKLAEVGECSQNLLGRYTAMDVATIKGVVERLNKRRLLISRADPDDRRRVMISLSPAGRRLFARHLRNALNATEVTLRPLRPANRATLIRLLKQLR
jgi:DNA-binding MarR family transcriptional regulator